MDTEELRALINGSRLWEEQSTENAAMEEQSTEETSLQALTEEPAAEESNAEELQTDETQTDEAQTEEPQTEDSQSAVHDGLFAYDRIPQEQKQLYQELYTILLKQQEDVRISTLDADLTDRVFQHVCSDHPELFFMEGYTITKYTTNNVVTSLTFSGKYTKTPQERETLQRQMEDAAALCLSGLPDTEDQYEKAKYIYEYLVLNTEYDLSAPDNQNIISVFLNKRSVCQGYAKAAQYLLQKAGIECALISGTADGGPHAWNLVCLNGTWCYMDATWGDASYRTVEGSTLAGGINYEYLGADDAIMQRTHHPVTSLTLPSCSSLEHYYYVREGNYLTEPDFEKVAGLFQKAYGEGADRVTIKCSSPEIYAYVLEELVTKQRFTELLADASGLRYVRMDESYTLICYL